MEPSDKELCERLARKCGIKITVHEGVDPQHGCKLRVDDCPDFVNDLNAVAQLRAVIAEWGLVIPFLKALRPLVWPEYFKSPIAEDNWTDRGCDSFMLLNATARQQALAADSVLPEIEGG